MKDATLTQAVREAHKNRGVLADRSLPILNPYAVLAAHRRGGPMKDRRSERGGAKRSLTLGSWE